MGLEAVMALLYKELETQQTKATHFYREREREREIWGVWFKQSFLVFK